MRLNVQIAMMNKSFCIFIISHGRPDKIVTLRTLKKCGYTGPLFIVCDNEDKTIDKYRADYPADMIVVFDKPKYAAMVDSCDNFQNRRTTTHARNACFDIAEEKGFDYFLVLDDDYNCFYYTFDRHGQFIKRRIVANIGYIFDAMIKFLECDERINSICFIQDGDIFGGAECTNFKDNIFPFKKRKAMNSFFCKTSRRFWFFSRLNEDVNTYLSLGSIGKLFFSIPDIVLNQAQTQSTSGGMSDAYLASGTYVKSFYTTMLFPSFARVTVPRSMNRLHHKISWNNAIPKILDESFKKHGQAV